MDKASYFFDCVRTLKLYSIEKEIEGVKALLKDETDSEKRRLLTKTLGDLLIKKNKISK